jgi:hypothetical protein
MSEEHYRHEHPLHYSELRRAEIQAEDAESCDPPASGLEAEEVESVTPGHVDS